MVTVMQPIESSVPLAKAFNKIIEKVQTLRIITLPRTFEDVRGEEASFKTSVYYQTILWEKWMHEVVARLQEWDATIDKYFDEFDGSWKYYALSKRLDFIKEWGSDDEADYNSDGSVKTTGIQNSQLKHHTIFQDLYHECVDIVQDSHPSDLRPLIQALDTNSRFSLSDVLYKATGKRIPSYTLDENGNIRTTTFAERELRKAIGMAEAHDYGHFVYSIAVLMEQLTKELELIAHSDSALSEQHNLLYAIQNDAYSILHMKLEETRFFKRNTIQKEQY